MPIKSKDLTLINSSRQKQLYFQLLELKKKTTVLTKGVVCDVQNHIRALACVFSGILITGPRYHLDTQSSTRSYVAGLG